LTLKKIKKTFCNLFRNLYNKNLNFLLMANFVERFIKGYELTEEECFERDEINQFKRFYSDYKSTSFEIHPTFFERIRRGVDYALNPEKLRQSN